MSNINNNSANTTMAIVLIAIAGVIIAGLIVIPVIEAAEAANPTSDARSKGKRGEAASGGKRSGQGPCIGICL